VHIDPRWFNSSGKLYPAALLGIHLRRSLIWGFGLFGLPIVFIFLSHTNAGVLPQEITEDLVIILGEPFRVVREYYIELTIHGEKHAAFVFVEFFTVAVVYFTAETFFALRLYFKKAQLVGMPGIGDAVMIAVGALSFFAMNKAPVYPGPTDSARGLHYDQTGFFYFKIHFSLWISAFALQNIVAIAMTTLRQWLDAPSSAPTD
jgi:hypothetical protein